MRLVGQVHFLRSFILLAVLASADCRCFDSIPGKHLELYAELISERGEDECLGSCLAAEFKCQSAQFNLETKTCFLNEETHLTQPSLFKSSDKYIFWFRNDQCDKNCYFQYFFKKYLLGFNTVVFDSYSSFQCLEECLIRSDLDCLSIDYNRDKQRCILSSESNDTKNDAFLEHTNLEHFQKICYAPEPEYPCFTDTHTGKYLKNHHKALHGLDEENCRIYCLTADFFCKSAHYKKDENICYLNVETHKTSPIYFKNDDKYVYWLRNDECKPNCYFKHFQKRRLIGFDDVVLISINKHLCIKECLTNNQINCSSFEYNENTKECRLSSESNDTKSQFWEPSDSFDYYHKICKIPQIQLPCFDEMYDGRFLINSEETISGRTEEECCASCLTSKILCKSVQYDRSTKLCYLNTETHRTTPENFVSNPYYVYWKRGEKCDLECYFDYSYKKYLLGFNTIRIKPFPSIKCLEQCFIAEDIECLSIDYNREKRECVLSIESKDTQPEMKLSHINLEHFHKVCPIKYPCFRLYSKKFLEDKTDQFSGKSEKECIQLCLLSETTCRSLSYNSNTEKCYISRKTKDSNPDSFVDNENFNYFQKLDECQPNCKVLPFPSYHLKDEYILSEKVDSEMDCIKMCVSRRPFGSCNSVDWFKDTFTCVLHKETRFSQPRSFRTLIASMHFHVSCGNVCFKEHPYRSLDGYDYSIIENISEDDCNSHCINSEETCRSTEYDKTKNQCFLSKENSITKPLGYKPSETKIYWERKEICRFDCYMIKYTNRYLMGQNVRTVQVVDKFECQELCLSEYLSSCKSAEYNQRTKTCYLGTETQHSKPWIWSTSSQYIYWDKVCREDFLCFDRHPGQFLNKYYDRKTDLSEEECVRWCHMAICNAINYKISTKECFLILLPDNEKPAVSFAGTNDYVYLPKKKSCHPNCYFKKVSNKYLIGFNDHSKIVPSEEHCLNLCITYFEWCRSFEYQKSTSRCVISKMFNINPELLRTNKDYSLYELNCKMNSSPGSKCFEKYKKKHINGYNTQTLSDQTEISCLEACLTTKNFICRSAEFSISTKKCYLSKESKTTRPSNYEDNSQFIYYHRKSECKLDCSIDTQLHKELENYDLKSFYTISNLECISECLITPGCLSVDRNEVTKRCDLHQVTKYTATDAFHTATSSTYWNVLCSH
ncbi:DgyrCDS12445 [Dimorphilus gyrociliatus]|uniref:DgyrCDS12445 n=1 Tax=Dimorphilus gyrociliatus TaxID=2664684 RepID=A0A7I8W8K5_9ANNE|nr:DgyrCDS12445 [Dimorphilus gyrociliatus]